MCVYIVFLFDMKCLEHRRRKSKNHLDVKMTLNHRSFSPFWKCTALWWWCALISEFIQRTSRDCRSSLRRLLPRRRSLRHLVPSLRPRHHHLHTSAPLPRHVTPTMPPRDRLWCLPVQWLLLLSLPCPVKHSLLYISLLRHCLTCHCCSVVDLFYLHSNLHHHLSCHTLHQWEHHQACGHRTWWVVHHITMPVCSWLHLVQLHLARCMALLLHCLALDHSLPLPRVSHHLRHLALLEHNRRHHHEEEVIWWEEEEWW